MKISIQAMIIQDYIWMNVRFLLTESQTKRETQIGSIHISPIGMLVG